MITPAPAGMRRRSDSTMTTLTSVVTPMLCTCGDHPHASQAKLANAAAALVSCGFTYPVSPASTASCSAALIPGASGKSISATNIGSTSAGNVPHFSLVRRRRDSSGSAFMLTSQAYYAPDRAPLARSPNYFRSTDELDREGNGG